MALPKELCRRAIFIAPDSEPSFGSDQAYDSFPLRFPTVSIELEATDILLDLAGFDGNFSIGLNGYTRTGLDNAIVCLRKDGQMSAIELDEEAQAEARVVLDGHLMARYGLDCAGMLDEAEKCVMRKEAPTWAK